MDSDSEDSLLSSSSSSDDEDEEFLTTSKSKSKSKKSSHHSSSEDREALIRRKLLESFYGKAPPPDGNDINESHSNSVTKNTTNSNVDINNRNANPQTSTPLHHHHRQTFTPSSPQSPSSTDIDSPTFNAQLYSTNLISSSTTHSLLSSSSNLTQSIRLLDSTMQTLVYENYSKFIDATDAIRSIGQSVSISESSLSTLSQSISSISTNIDTIENQISTQRNLVAEKIRVKKLVLRLTKLLSLPMTLKQYYKCKKYRLVMKDYNDSMGIIGQYSNGFESLKKIESDCGVIVKVMVRDIGKMVWCWCGGGEERGMRFKTATGNSVHSNNTGTASNNVGDGIMGVSDALDLFMRNGRMLFQLSSNDDDDDKYLSRNSTDKDYNHENHHLDDSIMEQEIVAISSMTDVIPPQSMSEIFECTGALLAYSSSASSANASTDKSQPSVNDDVSTILSKLSETECKVLSLQCCSKYLEGVLEDHAIDVQEERLKSIQDEALRMPISSNNDDNHDDNNTTKTEKHTLFPRRYLDSILEAATLYGVTFQSSQSNNIKGKKKIVKNEDNLLNEYVSKWFNSFLSHVKMVLIEWISDINSGKESRRSDNNTSNSLIDDQDDEDDVAFAEISRELMNLLRNVREVASGLSLPEIGLDMELASTLVEKTVGITESMVKKRVSQKFHLLRIRVLFSCLMPLVKDVLHEETNENDCDSLKTIKTIQAANVALSDGMQMVDDTIRSILSQGTGLGMSNTPLDLDMVKVAVANDARKFAFWLASALEKIAGCDPMDDNLTLSVKHSNMVDDGDSKDEHLMNATLLEAKSIENDEDEVESTDRRKENSILEDIYASIEENNQCCNGLLSLSLVEMCRLAARNVVNNMNQSISSSMEDDLRLSTKKDVFQLPTSLNSSILESDEIISIRFRLAAARALTLYAVTKGYEASSGVCRDVWESCSIQSEFFPHGPTEVTWKILETAKSTSIECAAAFGGKVFAGPIPNFSDDNNEYMRNGAIGAARGAMKGLSLDVARMFTQKVQVYPHHFEMIDFSRNAVVSLMLKVAFKAWIEQIRSCTLSAFAYRQLQVDTEFLKILLSHYVEEESASKEELQNILSDVVLNAGGRCDDIECVGATEYYDEARGKVLSPTSIAMAFLSEEDAAGKRGILGKFLIEEDNESGSKKTS